MAALTDSRLVDSTKLIAQLSAADRIAKALVGAFQSCEESGRPLSELQKVDLLRAALLEFDGFEAELAGMLDVERRLVGLSSNGRG